MIVYDHTLFKAFEAKSNGASSNAIRAINEIDSLLSSIETIINNFGYPVNIEYIDKENSFDITVRIKKEQLDYDTLALNQELLISESLPQDIKVFSNNARKDLMNILDQIDDIRKHASDLKKKIK